jgi:hypothetical protein
MYHVVVVNIANNIFPLLASILALYEIHFAYPLGSMDSDSEPQI